MRLKRQREAIAAQSRALQVTCLLSLTSSQPSHQVSLYPQRGGAEWRRELAALIIQLAWRQHVRRRLLQQSLKKQKVLHEWTPSVLAARQRMLVEKVYGQ